MFQAFYDIIILPQSGRKGRKNKMATIINIEEYRERKQHEADMAKLAEMREALFTNGRWTSMEDRSDFMIELSRLSELEESV